MIELLHFDKTLDLVDVKPYTSFSFSPHITDYQTFTAEISGNDVRTEHILTLIENRQPIFTGIVNDVKLSGGVSSIVGYDLKHMLTGELYNTLYGASPVVGVNVSGSARDVIADALQRFYDGYDIDVDNTVGTQTYVGMARLKTIYEALRELCLSMQVFYSFYVVGSGEIRLVIRPIRDMSHIVLPVNVTHTELSRRTRINYNQIVGLGAGENEGRDYHYIDNAGTDFPRCYIYDLREDISHEELVQRTQAKYNELILGEEYTIDILPNNVYEFGDDYGIGDYISFLTLDGEIVTDLVTQYSATIERGELRKSRELITGIYKGMLSDKIKELSEGGYR